MADSAPGGYYTGPPAVPHDKHKAAAPPSEPEPEPVDGQVNAPGGYYAGRPAKAAGGGSAAPKEPGFFARCCACFSGGERNRKIGSQ